MNALWAYFYTLYAYYSKIPVSFSFFFSKNNILKFLLSGNNNYYTISGKMKVNEIDDDQYSSSGSEMAQLEDVYMENNGITRTALRNNN